MTTKVLVVDDHAGFRAWAKVVLEQSGYTVLEAVDGASALRATTELAPAVVLVDVMLPDIDGFEVARRLGMGRANSDETGAPPVVVLTSTRDASDYGGRIERSGALGFLPKAELSGDTLALILDGGAAK
jgi:CheY-like chemotaxis protein